MAILYTLIMMAFPIMNEQWYKEANRHLLDGNQKLENSPISVTEKQKGEKNDYAINMKPESYEFINSTLRLSWPSGLTATANLVKSQGDCIFLGVFHADPGSSVLVTGCSVLDIQYQSQVLGNRFLVGHDGHIEHWGNHAEKRKRNRIAEFLEPEEDFIDYENVEGEVIVSNEKQLPAVLKLNVNVYLDTKWVEFHGSSANASHKAKEVMQHVAHLFGSNIQNTKIILAHNDNIYRSQSHLRPTEEDLAKLKDHLIGPWNIAGSRVDHVYLTYTSRVVTPSISVQDSICDEDPLAPRSITRWDGSVSRTAVAVAHALGHNLGVRHDHVLGAGVHEHCEEGGWTEEIVGNYATSGIAWSSCSRDAMAKYYNRVLAIYGQFCLASQQS